MPKERKKPASKLDSGALILDWRDHPLGSPVHGLGIGLRCAKLHCVDSLQRRWGLSCPDPLELLLGPVGKVIDRHVPGVKACLELRIVGLDLLKVGLEDAPSPLKLLGAIGSRKLLAESCEVVALVEGSLSLQIKATAPNLGNTCLGRRAALELCGVHLAARQPSLRSLSTLLGGRAGAAVRCGQSEQGQSDESHPFRQMGVLKSFRSPSLLRQVSIEHKNMLLLASLSSYTCSRQGPPPSPKRKKQKPGDPQTRLRAAFELLAAALPAAGVSGRIRLIDRPLVLHANSTKREAERAPSVTSWTHRTFPLRQVAVPQFLQHACGLAKRVYTPQAHMIMISAKPGQFRQHSSEPDHLGCQGCM